MEKGRTHLRNVIKLNLWAHIKSTHPILNGVGTFSTGAGHRFYMMQLFISYSSKSSVHLFDKLEIVNIFSVSAISFSINGRILSFYLDKSARLRLDNILGIYCGFAKPTCARALTHCLAVIGFSSIICVRKSDIIESK